MNKKEFSLIQHNLIPAALLLGNLALAHLIYACSYGENYLMIAAPLIALIFLAGAVIKANKYLLMTAILIYSALLLLTLMF